MVKLVLEETLCPDRTSLSDGAIALGTSSEKGLADR